jgi:hypothetical protein
MPIDLPSKSRLLVIPLPAAPLALLINARKLFRMSQHFFQLSLSLSLPLSSCISQRSAVIVDTSEIYISR